MLTGVFAICGVLGLALLPPEHVHLTRTRDGHHAELIHRHLESHFGTGHSNALHDGDDDVEWLQAAFTVPPVSPLAFSAIELTDGRPLVPRRATGAEKVISSVRLSAHDPPWVPTSGLRAPPSLPA